MAVAVRDLEEADIQHILNYWFHSPMGFIEAMGVDLNKVGTEAQMQKMLADKIAQNRELPVSKLNAQVITYEGVAVGFHTINPIVEGDHGVFHAHIWDRDRRGCGIAGHSYLLACHVFMERFDLKNILFKTPSHNKGPHRVKEKLGIRVIGEELISFGIMKENTPATVYELTREELVRLSQSLA